MTVETLYCNEIFMNIEFDEAYDKQKKSLNKKFEQICTCLSVKIKDPIQKMYLCEISIMHVILTRIEYLIQIKTPSQVLLDMKKSIINMFLYFKNQLHFDNSCITSLYYKIDDLFTSILLVYANDNDGVKFILKEVEEKIKNIYKKSTVSTNYEHILINHTYNFQYNNRHEHKCSDYDYQDFLKVFI